MKHFLKPDNSIWAFEENGSQDHLITGDMSPLSLVQLAALLIPPKTQAQLDQEASDKAKEALITIDLASIRAIREWIVKQPNSPQILRDREIEATLERRKII